MFSLIERPINPRQSNCCFEFISIIIAFETPSFINSTSFKNEYIHLVNLIVLLITYVHGDLTKGSLIRVSSNKTWNSVPSFKKLFRLSNNYAYLFNDGLKDFIRPLIGNTLKMWKIITHIIYIQINFEARPFLIIAHLLGFSVIFHNELYGEEPSTQSNP